MTKKRDPFLEGLERKRQMHLKHAPSHMDHKPTSEMGDEEIEAEMQRLQLERVKAETAYWQDKRQANLEASTEFGLASNRGRAGGSALAATLNELKAKARRKYWR